MLEKFKLTEVWLKIALLFVFSAFYAAALSFPEQARQFPQLLAVAGLAMTAIALATDFTRKRAVRAEISGVDDTELKVLDAEEVRARRKRYYRAWAIILLSTIVGYLGGFLFSAIGLFAGFALFFGSRAKLPRDLVVGAAMTAVVYFVFGVLMSVPLLNGVLW
jgi:hypothetical protein